MAETYRHSTYVPPTTDKSYGSNSNEVNARPQGYAKLGPNEGRVTLAGNDGLVEIGGVRTTREAAEAAGLIAPGGKDIPATHQNAPLTDEGLKADAQKRIADQNEARAAAEQQARMDNFNSTLDHFEAQLGPQYSEFVSAALDDATDADEATGEAISLVPDHVIDTYVGVAENFLMDAGLPPELAHGAMADMLEPSDRREALNALLKGDAQTFNRVAERAFNEVLQVTQTADFADMVREAGGQIVNGELIHHGENLGPLVKCLLNGTLKWTD